MNKFLSVLTLAALLSISAVQALTAEQTVEIIAGIMDGVILKDNLVEIKTCITDVDTVTKEVEDIAADFEKMSIYGIFSGIKELGTLLSQFSGFLNQCESIKPDVQLFEKWASVFIHPTELIAKLATNLPAHLNEILPDIQEANKDY